MSLNKINTKEIIAILKSQGKNTKGLHSNLMAVIEASDIDCEINPSFNEDRKESIIFDIKDMDRLIDYIEKYMNSNKEERNKFLERINSLRENNVSEHSATVYFSAVNKHIMQILKQIKVISTKDIYAMIDNDLKNSSQHSNLMYVIEASNINCEIKRISSGNKENVFFNTKDIYKIIEFVENYLDGKVDIDNKFKQGKQDKSINMIFKSVHTYIIPILRKIFDSEEVKETKETEEKILEEKMLEYEDKRSKLLNLTQYSESDIDSLLEAIKTILKIYSEIDLEMFEGRIIIKDKYILTTNEEDKNSKFFKNYKVFVLDLGNVQRSIFLALAEIQ